MKCLSVRQPWAWLLFRGKPVENRDWYCGHRGRLAIHASKGMTKAEYEDAVLFVEHFDESLALLIPRPENLVLGAVIGTVNMVACVKSHPSPFFQGKYGWLFEDPQQMYPPVQIKGSLGLWDWTSPGTANEQRNEAEPHAGGKEK